MSLNGYLIGVNADDDYGISLLSIADENYLGYVSLVNTGYNEWDSLISLIDSWNPSQFDNYVVTFGNDGTGRLLGNLTSNNNGTYTAAAVNTFVCTSLSTGCVARSNATSSFNPANTYFLSMSNVPQDNYYSDIVNWNLVNWEQAKAYYINSDSSQATTQDVIDTINDQWSMDDNENLGVADLVPEVEEKLGVLGFASDTLIQFVDLFNPDNINGTGLTFPAFSIDVQGESYQVWSDYTYDLNTLYDDFSFLIDTVRTILTLFVWIAVFNYCVKSYERFVTE